MNYPVWDVPHLGGMLVIAFIAIFHVLISHFAIGGGFYLPLTEAKALREGRRDWLDALRGYSKFFLILTGVFGAISGVGIWFSIGLASPEATSTLIHYFVFAWAMEWVVFIIELTAIAVYYYLWNRVSDATHLRIAWLYAISAWLSLFAINGIITFMLTPGAAWLAVAGTGREASAFASAFFNPTFWPSLCTRTMICVSLAGVFALVTASRIDGRDKPRLKTDLVHWAVRWLVPSFLLMPLCFFWYLSQIPDAQRAVLQLGVSTIGAGVFSQVTRLAFVLVLSSATLLAVVYFLAWRNPTQLSLGQALVVVFLALAATSSTDQVREMIRKPYVIVDHMYSNGVRKSEVAQFNRDGYLSSSIWLTPEERAAWAAPDAPANIVRGELMFRGQCMACHTLDGYRSMRRLLSTRDRQAIENLVKLLHEPTPDSPYVKFMPPLVGTPVEVQSITDYLVSLVATNAPQGN